MRQVLRLTVIVVAFGTNSLVAADEPIKVQSAIVKVLEEAEVPARDAGVLATLNIREGHRVKAGQVLGQLDDEEVQVAGQRAELELTIAETQLKSTLIVRTAEAVLREAEEDRKQIELTHRIASKKSDNDVAIRHAGKSRDASKAELDRALQSRKTFAASVSQAEIDRLKLIVERNELEIEKAEFEKEIADLQKQIEDASIAEQEHTVARLKLSVEQAQTQKEIERLNRDLKSRAVEHAKLQLQRRQIRSPLEGVVVEVFRHRGEWLEPGQRVLRIVRLDRLRVEGFVDSRQIHGDFGGANVRVIVESALGKKISVPGKVVFVSPEIDPVNNQVRVWAEVENPDFELRPGMTASEFLIDTTKRDTKEK